MTKHYDYIAIGGGSGGIASINRAAMYGQKCALIEAKALGGTCVNVGCVPKKVMWHAAQIREAIHLYGPDYGFDTTINHFDWDKLVAIMPATMIDFRDYPPLNIDTPDTSHIDIKDIDRQTLEGQRFEQDAQAELNELQQQLIPRRAQRGSLQENDGQRKHDQQQVDEGSGSPLTEVGTAQGFFHSRHAVAAGAEALGLRQMLAAALPYQRRQRRLAAAKTSPSNPVLPPADARLPACLAQPHHPGP